MLLKDRVALVTGASRGIGKAIAETFAREGATVAICGRKQDTLDAVAREINAANPAARCCPSPAMWDAWTTSSA